MENRDDFNPFEPPQTQPWKGPGPAPESDEIPVAVPNTNAHVRIIVLATFDNPVDAHQLRAELAKNGIESRLGNETSSPMLGATIAGQSAAFWIEVLILESDAERAFEVKQHFRKNNDGEMIPEWTCKCGETVDAGFATCWNCMADFELSE